MKATNIFDLGAGALLVALVTTVVTSRQSASIVTAAANGFSAIIQSSLGKGVINR